MVVTVYLFLICFTEAIVTDVSFVLILLNLKDDFGTKFTPLLLEHLAIFMVPSDMFDNWKYMNISAKTGIPFLNNLEYISPQFSYHIILLRWIFSLFLLFCVLCRWFAVTSNCRCIWSCRFIQPLRGNVVIFQSLI